MATDMKKVDIFINGRTYGINCPSDEEDALNRAASYINQFVQDVRRQAPQLPQEELLVLCALTLYEKSEALSHHQAPDEQAQTIVNQLLEQTQQLVR